MLDTVEMGITDNYIKGTHFILTTTSMAAESYDAQVHSKHSLFENPIHENQLQCTSKSHTLQLKIIRKTGEIE